MQKLPVFFMSLVLAFSFLPARSVENGLDDDILRYTNQFRRSRGLSPLKMDDYLNKLAEKHSEDMAKGRCEFGHSGFEKREREAEKKIHCVAFAENVAYGAESAKEVVDMWESSPGHRKNMLGDYRYIGIGIDRSKDGTIYFTQVFAK